ncbi:hypothetical protein B7P43_G11582 [Cryptotermes secundus]|uniref:DDE-1 domain-containing protein n=1 Tax=Cryptotermes secundus TaxID=105785 RepID=A0A2J7QVW9_9NEOP|nr:hypothetical protein B7P43_G11582 [Cryptotermes secundus]
MIMKKVDFRESDGWLDKFKNQLGISFLTIIREKLSCYVKVVDHFVRKFQEKIEELGLLPEQMYNTDKSSLFWGLLPTKTFVHQAEENAAGCKMSKDQIVFMPCSNASGTHKLGMLVIGEAAKPRAFKNQSLPVLYKSQSRGWVRQEVFTEWFHESFEPLIKTFLKKQNVPIKALLILENAPGHPNEEQVKSRDGLNE